MRGGRPPAHGAGGSPPRRPPRARVRRRRAERGAMNGSKRKNREKELHRDTRYSPSALERSDTHNTLHTSTSTHAHIISDPARVRSTLRSSRRPRASSARASSCLRVFGARACGGPHHAPHARVQNKTDSATYLLALCVAASPLLRLLLLRVGAASAPVLDTRHAESSMHRHRMRESPTTCPAAAS